MSERMVMKWLLFRTGGCRVLTRWVCYGSPIHSDLCYTAKNVSVWNQ